MDKFFAPYKNAGLGPVFTYSLKRKNAVNVTYSRIEKWHHDDPAFFLRVQWQFAFVLSRKRTRATHSKRVKLDFEGYAGKGARIVGPLDSWIYTLHDIFSTMRRYSLFFVGWQAQRPHYCTIILIEVERAALSYTFAASKQCYERWYRSKTY